VTRYSRQDVLRILQISPRQLHWLGASRTDFRQRTVRFSRSGPTAHAARVAALRMSPRSIRNSVQAMKAVSGMAIRCLSRRCSHRRPAGLPPLRHHGRSHPPPVALRFRIPAAGSGRRSVTVSMLPPTRTAGSRDPELQSLFLNAVQAEEQGRKQAAMEIYAEILAIDPVYTAALINLGTLHYHQKQYARAESSIAAPRRPIPPTYSLSSIWAMFWTSSAPRRIHRRLSPRHRARAGLRGRSLQPGPGL
jgi:hypothetical protein